MCKWTKRKEGKRGQSLTEFAIVLPVLLIIVAGVVEVGNLLTLYNRLQLAAREGTRYGGAGGTDEDIAGVVQAAVQYSLVEAQQDVYVIRPTVADDVSGWGDTWDSDDDELLVFGDGNWDGNDGAEPNSGLDPTRVFNDLLAGTDPGHPENIAGLEVVVVVVNYEADTVLGLPILPGYEGRVPLRAYNVMPIQTNAMEAEGQTTGCFFYPLAVNYDDVLEYWWEEYWEVGGLTFTTADRRAREGEFITIDLPIASDGQHWDFLICNIIHGGASDMAQTMMSEGCRGSRESTLYTNPVDPDDHALGCGDWVWGVPSYTSYAGGLGNALLTHCKTTGGGGSCIGLEGDPRAIRVIVYDQMARLAVPSEGYNPAYHVAGFIIVRILDFQPHVQQSPPPFIRAQFIGWDESCGGCEGSLRALQEE